MKQILFSLFFLLGILMCSDAQIINTIAGTTEGFSGDGGMATAAQLNRPTSTVVDVNGNVYISDYYNHRIRKISTTGVITTIAGTGTGGFNGDGGAATNARIFSPQGLALDAFGDLYIADAGNNRIRKVTISTGIITTVAGNGSPFYNGDAITAVSAGISQPNDVWVGVSGKMYICDDNYRIRVVEGGIISTIAGNGTQGSSGDGGQATSARIYRPSGVAVDASGNVYIADILNQSIRKVTVSSGIITKIAGTGNAAFSGDGGAATAAEISYPDDLWVDAAGNVFIADAGNNRIRKISTSGIITTVAGSGSGGFSGDGGLAINAGLYNPDGLSLDAGGNMFIAEYASMKVRKVMQPPVITSFTPTNVTTGTTVTITGTNFTTAYSVTLGGDQPSSYTILSSTTITAVVGTVGLTGEVAVNSSYGTGTLGGLTFGTAPTISSFTPTTAYTGNTVTINGTNFRSPFLVKFGGTTATSATLVSANQITAVVGSGTSGNVTVTTNGGTATRAGFVIPVPTITSFTPTAQRIGGSVTITGTNFTGASSVKFGGTAATSFTVNSVTQITAVVGAGSNGGDVSVTTGGGTATRAGFTIATPTITSHTPAAQYVGGTVTIAGTNLSGATSVKFGGVEAASFTANTAGTQITAVVSVTGASGSITVTTPGGTATRAGFTIPPPTITSFTPTSSAVNIWITINGTNLSGTSSVKFGGVEAQQIGNISPTMVTALVAMTGASGNVEVTTPGGTTTRAGFTIAAPAITSFAPTSAAIGTTVIITGNHYNGVSSVKFGNVEAASFTLLSNNQIAAVVAPGSNSGNISVTTIGGTATLGGFTFVPPPVISNFTPTSAAPGSTITINGSNLTGVTAVSFGGMPATSFSIISATQITAVLSQGSTGSVVVTGPGGNASLSGFTIVKPIITSFTPASANAGTTITITGSGFDASAANNVVYVGGVKTPVTSASTTSITVLAPVSHNQTVISITVKGLTGYSVKPFITKFPAADTIASSAFEPMPNIYQQNPGSIPRLVLKADLNNDGKMDIVTAREGQFLSIYQNATGTPSTPALGARIDLATLNSSSYSGLHVVDVDGDGNQDIILSYTNGYYSVYRNTISGTGNISFAPKADITSAFNGGQSIVADFDNDGKPDIGLATYTGLIGIMKNVSTVGNVSFLSSPLSLNFNGQISGLKSADLNQDGLPDIIGSRQDSLIIFKNTTVNGILSFEKQRLLNTNHANLAIADFDNDGRVDILGGAVVTFNIYRNISTGSQINFDPFVQFGNNGGPSIQVAEITGDGKVDILTQNGSLAISAHQNNSSGTGISFKQGVSLNGSGILSGDFALSDLNGDALPDLTMGNYSNSIITILRNRINAPGITSFTPTIVGVGHTVTIKGYNFSIISQVSFGSTPATSFIIVNDTTITAVVPNLGTAQLTNRIITITSPGGTASRNGLTYVPPPTISSFSPTTVATGQNVNIYGTYFTDASAVTFGGTPVASFTVLSATQIRAVVANGSTGDVLVTTPYGTVTQSTITYIPPPTITSFTPQAGVSGTSITITGTNFTDATLVSIGGNYTTFTVVNANTITTTVPAGAVSGNVTVTTFGGTATASGYVHTAITSFTPTQAATGATVTINGTNLNGATGVTFGGVSATSFIQVSATQITAVVANGATGSVNVTTPAGIATRTGFTYIPPPTITSFTPVAAPVGGVITITGTNLNWQPVTVRFGGVAATSVTVINATTIQATVSVGATGDITVTTAGGTTTLAGFTFLKPLILATTTQSFCPNINTTYPATIDVPVTVRNFTEVVSLQGSISWDNSIMQLNGITDFGPANLSLTASNFNTPIPGKLVYVWHDADVAGETLADNTVLFVMRFNIPTLFSSATSSPVQFLDNPVVMEATHKTVNPIPVSVTHGAVNLPAAALINALRPVTFCNGDSTILTTTYGGTKQWYKDNVAIIGATGNSYTVKTAGVFKLVATVGACQFLSNGITTFVKAVPPAPTATSNSPINLGDILNLSASLIPNALYTWTTPNIQTYYGQNVQILNATTALTGTYSVTATVDGCTSTPATVSVVVNNIVFIKGRILYPNINRDSVPYVTVKLSGTSTQTVTTGTDGRYSFQVTPNGNYTITPSKNNDITKANGVSVLDVAVIQSHILLRDYLNSPFKYIAADANSSGTITAVDLVHIKRLILGIDGTFPGNKLWNFVDSSNAFISTNPITYNATKTFNSLPWSVLKENFYGIKIGDVTWNWNYTIFRRQGEKISLYHDTAYADAKDSIIIPIKVSDFKDVMALQYTLSWNHRKMDFAGIRKNTLGLEFGTQEAFKGNLSALWVDAGINNKSLNDGTVLFELVLKKKNGVVLDVETLDINSNIANIEAYDKDYAPISLAKGTSVILDRKAGAGNSQGVSSFTVTPNPSNGNIRIRLVAASAKKVEIVLTDISGKAFYKKSEGVFQGENIINLNLKKNGVLAAGTYFLSIKGLEKTLTEQIIIAE